MVEWSIQALAVFSSSNKKAFNKEGISAKLNPNFLNLPQLKYNKVKISQYINLSTQSIEKT